MNRQILVSVLFCGNVIAYRAFTTHGMAAEWRAKWDKFGDYEPDGPQFETVMETGFVGEWEGNNGVKAPDTLREYW